MCVCVCVCVWWVCVCVRVRLCVLFYLIKYASDCTISSSKLQKLPTVGGGHPPKIDDIVLGYYVFSDKSAEKVPYIFVIK